jgi:hypothetical protein
VPHVSAGDQLDNNLGHQPIFAIDACAGPNPSKLAATDIDPVQSVWRWDGESLQALVAGLKNSITYVHPRFITRTTNAALLVACHADGAMDYVVLTVWARKLCHRCDLLPLQVTFARSAVLRPGAELLRVRETRAGGREASVAGGSGWSLITRCHRHDRMTTCGLERPGWCRPRMIAEKPGRI